MHRLNGKRVMRIVHNMLSTNDTPVSVGIFLESMCREYGFDRVRSYIKLPGTNEYKHLHDVHAGGSWALLDNEKNIDMSKTYYPKVSDTLYDIGEKIYEEQFIYFKDFQKHIKDMSTVGYIADESNIVEEALISCVRSTDESFGSFGYFIFEKYENREPITPIEIDEIKDLCKVCNGRIVSFETSKQLRTEEISKLVDDLTQLPVIDIFYEKVKEQINNNLPVSILYLDIDKFKYINEIWGYDKGNEILISVGQVLSDFIEIDENVCRISEDKFGVSLHTKDIDTLKLRLEELNETFYEMQQREFPQIKITIITGVFIAFEEVSVDMALDKANIARSAVKGSYKNIYHCYNDALDSYSEREKELENKMMYALEHGEFIPYIQPKFDLKTGKIMGAEALVRWVRSDGIIAPDEFIPIFEKNGFITKMDFAIYEQVFAFIQSQRQQGKTVVPISVNVSREHLENKNFVKEFCELMNDYKITVDMIEIELTENIFVKEKFILKRFIEEIRERGIAVSIDDFGIAYSSLNLLNEVEVDVIKIDKSFITNLAIDNSEKSRDKVIIKNVLNMIHELGIKSVFEGVETQKQVEFLKDVGCAYAQGYFYEKPMVLEDFKSKYL